VHVEEEAGMVQERSPEAKGSKRANPKTHSARPGKLLLPILALVYLSLVLVGCRSFNVQTDWDSAVAFGELKNFHFVEPPKIEGADPFADNSLLRKRVQRAVEQVLIERGYRSAGTREDADFVVTFAVLLDQEFRVNGVSAGGGGYRGRGYGVGGGYSSANVRSFQESTLLLDLLNPSTEDILWRGWGTGIVGTRDRDRSDERMDKGVRAILDKFPPD
jgi:hypothetical protein